MRKSYRRIIFINILIALAYWGISHLNWLFFHKVGILPMPVWPAAALALFAALYWGWEIAPALALGTILANHYSLGATWVYSLCIAIMNTLGPLTAAWLLRSKKSADKFGMLTKFLWLIAAGLILAPAMTATGGIGSQWLLGIIQTEEFPVKWIRWFMAHSAGTLLFVCPVFVLYPSLWHQESDKKENDWLEYASKTTLILTAGLALLLWLGESFIRFLWFERETISLTENLLPVHSPLELLCRIFIFITVLFAGVAASRLLKRLSESQRNLEKSNKALQESEALQNILRENLPTGVIIVDPETKIIEEVNNTAAAMFGLDKKDITGRVCHSFLCPNNEGNCQVCGLDQDADEPELKMIRADGSIHPVLKSVRHVQILGKEKLLECLTDITDQKQADEEKALRNALLSAQQEASIDGILAVDGNGNTIMFNRRFVEMWNIPPDIIATKSDELILKSVQGILADPDEFMKKVKYLYDHYQETSRDEIPLKDGRVFDRYSSPMFGQDNRYFGRVWYFRDITERKQAERALMESEAMLRREQQYIQLLLDTSPVFIVAIGFDGKTLMMNKALLDALEYKKDEIIGSDYLTTFVPEEDRATLSLVFKQITDERKATLNENRIMSKSGKTYLVEWHGRTSIQANGHFNFFVGVGIDITERKKSEEEKKKLEDQLIHSQKLESIGRLAGGVAHDFNNMLNVILGYTELLIAETGRDHPFHAHLEEIQNAAEHSADLTSQLLAFARKQTIAPKILDLNETIGVMLNMLRRLIGEDINLEWIPCENLWKINIDPSQIDQVLVNLLVNSRDAIKGIGKISIETDNVFFNESYCAMHAGFVQGEYVMLAVSDNGCGMDEETLGHIYEPFFTTKAKGKGIGLGMATVYGIIKQNNGFINIYSEPGKGTTVKIYLTRYLEKTVTPSFEDMTKEAVGGNETILIVEDEPATLKLGKIILEGLGYTVLTANMPGEAIRIVEENARKINLLITDVIMPDMNGRDLANKVLSICPDIKYIFMSGYTENIIAHHGILEKGVYFIQKPFSKNNLAAKVREALDN